FKIDGHDAWVQFNVFVEVRAEERQLFSFGEGFCLGLHDICELLPECSPVEIASGSHPYAKWKTPFEQLKQVVHDAAPKLARSLGYSEYFEDFVAHCLTKDYNQRPKYPDLLAHAFLEAARNERHFDMGAFITEMMGVAERERESVLQGINMQAPVSATLGAMTLDAS
ncbi:unnamed protein product, partial [Toxocara canis]|uniref:Protein kinase domain-containing protein n=1 Tax=Toxocara canis TaxID=6265 RepID=A0A183TYY1_TOXCA